MPFIFLLIEWLKVERNIKLLNQPLLLVLRNTDWGDHIAAMGQSLLIQVKLLRQFPGFIGISGLKPLQSIEGDLDVPSRHVVGKGIIVDVFVPFVGANHVADLIIFALWLPFYPAAPKLSSA